MFGGHLIKGNLSSAKGSGMSAFRKPLFVRIYLLLSCDTVIPSGYQREKGENFYSCFMSSSTLIMGRSPNKHPLCSTTGGHLFWGCPLPGVLLSTKHMEKFLSVCVAQLTFRNIPPTKQKGYSPLFPFILQGKGYIHLFSLLFCRRDIQI